MHVRTTTGEPTGSIEDDFVPDEHDTDQFALRRPHPAPHAGAHRYGPCRLGRRGGGPGRRSSRSQGAGQSYSCADGVTHTDDVLLT